MSYVPFALRYRPQKFEDLVGQDQANLILRGIVTSGKLPNALLFTGPRGSGKTSSARVFAKALNCLNRTGADPCDNCSMCASIKTGTCIDVQEFDAASRGLVDNVRDLKQAINYSAAEAKYRVYIIDEVHAMSRQGFDAMLKMVEETPTHVKFIFCTTEAYRIPDTIISRTLRFDFKRITVDVIVTRLKMIAEKEGVKVENDEVFYLIAKHADGGMRDAIGKLEQVSHLGDVVKVDALIEFLGVIGGDIYVDLMDMIIKKDVVEVSIMVKKIVERNADLGNFMKGFGEYLHHLVVAKLGVNVYFSKDRLDSVRKQLEKLTDSYLLAAFDVVSNLVYKIRKGDIDAKLELEVGLMRLVSMLEYTPPPTVMEKPAMIERDDQIFVSSDNLADAFK